MTLVCTASNGLYSEAVTCFIAAAWMMHVGTLAARVQTPPIADVADEVAQPVVVEALLHLGLLEFVAREDPDRGVGQVRQDPPTKALPNDPVPPVRRMVEPLSVIVSS